MKLGISKTKSDTFSSLTCLLYFTIYTRKSDIKKVFKKLVIESNFSFSTILFTYIENEKVITRNWSIKCRVLLVPLIYSFIHLQCTLVPWVTPSYYVKPIRWPIIAQSWRWTAKKEKRNNYFCLMSNNTYTIKKQRPLCNCHVIFPSSNLLR